MLVLITVLSRLLRTRALVALTCIWATLLFANIASAVPHVQAKTRVWGFGQSAPLHIWLDASVTPRSRPEIRSASPDLASRSLLAARGVVAGEAGAFRDLVARRVVGDALTPHHMPQAAMGFTSRAEGGALVLPEAEHALTRTFAGRGLGTARAEAGMSFRDVLARDIRDIRQLAGTKYDQGLRDLLQYYKTNSPNLMQR